MVVNTRFAEELLGYDFPGSVKSIIKVQWDVPVFAPDFLYNRRGD